VPSSEGGEDTIVGLLNDGDEVAILGEPEEGDDGLTWVEVDTDELGDGYVTTDYLDPEQ
jgi:hypothetical protein